MRRSASPPVASAATGPSHRLFFALWPDAGVAAELARLAAQAQQHWGGRSVPREALHLTLAFLGAVAPAQLAVLEDLGRDLVAAAFMLQLDRLAWHRRQGIVWVAPTDMPPALAALAEALQRRLAAAGFDTERRPFAAHVTLLRHARQGDAARVPAAPLDWAVQEFVLAESALHPGGARYRIRARWTLGADGASAGLPT